MRIYHTVLNKNNMREAIAVNNISKRFRIPHQRRTTVLQKGIALFNHKKNYEEFWAVKDVSFAVGRGETFGIIGRNGSGKSTLLKMLARVMYPDSGSISLNGKVASFLELGVGFQPELTASENIFIYAAILGMSRRETNAVYDDIFEFAELKKFEDMKLKNFSSGMYLRLAFSTAINCNPDIILIDEVLAVGDTAFQKKCMKRIDEFQENGKTIILVSHSLEQVRKMCKRSLLLDHGQVVSHGNTQKVIDYYYNILEGNAELERKDDAASPVPQIAGENAGEDIEGISCCVTHSVSQPVPHDESVAVKFDSTRWDTDNIHSNRAQNSRMTCRTAGIYAIFGCVEFDASGVGRRVLNIQLNGNQILTSQHVMAVTDAGIGTSVNVSCVQYLNEGDYIELTVKQGSGVTLNINPKPYYSPELSLTRIG